MRRFKEEEVLTPVDSQAQKAIDAERALE